MSRLSSAAGPHNIDDSSRWVCNINKAALDWSTLSAAEPEIGREAISFSNASARSKRPVRRFKATSSANARSTSAFARGSLISFPWLQAASHSPIARVK